MKVLDKHTVQRYNEQAADDVVRLKLKMTENVCESKVPDRMIFKGLKLHDAPEDVRYQMLQPKLFSNPFFVAPKTKNKKKGKKVTK